MAAIWKFPLAVKDEVTLPLPTNAEALTVQIQNELPMLWCLVNPGAALEPRLFRTYGTGHPIVGAPGKYVATYQLEGGQLVFHVFDMGVVVRHKEKE